MECSGGLNLVEKKETTVSAAAAQIIQTKMKPRELQTFITSFITSIE